MKTVIIFLSLFYTSSIVAQDIINQYDFDEVIGQMFPSSIYYYDGEYQILIDHMYWNDENINFPPGINFISYDFECVSFPFFPSCYTNNLGSNCLGAPERSFDVLSDGTINENLIGPNDVTGEGWAGSEGNIFRKINPTSFSQHWNSLKKRYFMSGITSLVSQSYNGELGDSRVQLPHSVLRISLNVHMGENITDDIAMRISWLHDNTRGRMKFYPFIDHNNGVGAHKSHYDVLFRPKILFNVNSGHFYNTNSNVDWFIEGARPIGLELGDPEGSINYFDIGDINGTPDPVFYPSPPYPSPAGFPSWRYYPAPYTLLSAPLMNYTGKAYAGFSNDGTIDPSVHDGIQHSYVINEPIILNNINPTEKIIYNPSEVTIDANITFPAGYKFLTVHGKYPDKSWVEYNNINNYEDLRDVLCPSDQVGINGEFLSEYIISWGKTLTVEEGVIIMDAKFSGFGTIKYNPYKVYGNFKIGENGPVKFYKIESDLTITQGQHYVWENDVEFLAGKLTIKNGASLTIHEKVIISPVTKIVVERGGKLVLDGGTLTNHYNWSEELWRGIEVWGNPTLSSTESNQGSVFVINGGTIENAIVGIRTAKTVQDEESETIDLSFSGGIVKVSDGRFVNNMTAISFYKYPAAGYSHQYSGMIMNNTSFETNDAYVSAVYPRYFIYMNDINRVTLAACTFLDNTSQQIKQSGVYSFNSQFIIKGSTSGGSGYNSNFKKLNYGVYALASTPNRFPDISHTGFEDNQKGVYLSGLSNAQVNYCNFTTSAGQTGSYGLYLDGCRSYWAEGNEFSNAGPSNLFGIYVNDTRPTGPEMIYRNYFSGLNVGIIALNRNRTRSGEGLVLKCNEYVNTYWNQVVYFEGMFFTPELGIASSQGANIQLPDGPAGNLFSNSNPDSDTDIFNNANFLDYYHHNVINIPLIPLYYTDGKVEPKPVNAQWNQTSCLPVISSNGGELPGDEELRTLLATSSLKSDSLQDIIHLLKDGGDTQTLKWEVDMSTSPEAYEIYSSLMNTSPYISDTVMVAAIEKESVLVNAMIRDVMVANPHNAKNEELLAKVDERVNPMPSYMKAQILQGRSLVSVFEELQSQLGFYKHQREAVFNELVKLYISDTVQPAASADSLMALLSAEQKATANYLKAAIYMNQGDWVSCLNVINTIPQQFVLTPEQAAEHAQMTALYTLMAGQVQDGKTLDESTPQQLNLLSDIESADAGIPSVYARNILIDLNVSVYEEPVLYPDPYKSATIQEEYDVLKQALEQHHFIRLSPNPAGNYLIIEHELEVVKGHPFAEIRNIKGDLEMIVRLTGIQNQQAIDITGLKPGTYIVTLFNGRQKVETAKFTKTR